MQKINKTTVFLPFSSLECERFPLRVIVAGGGGGGVEGGSIPIFVATRKPIIICSRN